MSGGGNSLKPSHNQGFDLIEAFNNLALWGEKKFVSELKRTYKFQRGVNNILDCHCHTEDNSPKYRMVGEILSILRSFAVQTRIFAKECNIIAEGYVRSTAHFSLKSAAFTLAEVLITLGIIGVVAAMTMPSLVQNYQKKALETGLKKSYSVLSQAVQRMIEEDGEIPSRASVGSTNDNWVAFEKSLSQHLKIVKYCSYSSNGMSNKCISGDSFASWFGSTYKSYNKKTLGTAVWWFDDGMYVLADGSFLFLDVSVSNDVLLNIDINGSKAPNALGHDVFLFAIDHETGKLRPYGGETKDDTTQKLCDKISNDGNNGLGCTAKAFENMDEYFKNLP